MNHFVSVSVRKAMKLWLSCLVELLLFLPLWVLFQGYALPEQIETMWMVGLPILSMAGVLLRYRCNIRWKQWTGSLLLGAAFGVLSAGSLSIHGIPLAVAGFLCTYLGMTADGRSGRSKVYWTGITIYFIAAIVFARIPQLQASSSLLTWSGSLFLVVTLLISNRDYLHYSSLSEENAPLPRGLQRYNRLLVIIILIAAALLAAGLGKALGLLIWNAARTVLAWIVRLFSGSGENPVQQVPQPPVTPVLPPAEAGEPGLLATILNISFYVLAAAVIGMLVYYGLRWLYRNTGGMWKRAMDTLLSVLRKEHSPQETAPYLDEEKSIFTWENTVQGFKDFWKTRFTIGNRRERWEQMNGGRERVRWLYRRWLGSKQERGYAWKSYLTPQETQADIVKWAQRGKQRKAAAGNSAAPDTLVKLYEKVRYAEEEPSAEEVAALKEMLKL